VKIKGANTDTIPLASALKTCGWFITKRPVHTGARVLGAVLLVVTSMAEAYHSVLVDCA